jgi:hypothetical protein
MLNADLGRKLNGLVEFICDNYENRVIRSVEVNHVTSWDDHLQSSSSTELYIKVGGIGEGYALEVYAYKSGLFSVSLLVDGKDGLSKTFTFCDKKEQSQFMYNTDNLPSNCIILCSNFYKGIQKYIG